MPGILLTLGFIAILIFIITSMMVMGLNVTIDDLISAFRDVKLILSILVANFFLVPALAFAIIYLIPVSKEMAAGLILVSVAAGAPSTPKVAELTGGDISYAVAMTIIMTVLTIILMPIILPFLLDGVTMDSSKIAVNLVVLMLIPLLLGMGLRHTSHRAAKRLNSAFFWVSNASIGIIFLAFGVLLLSRIETLFGGSSGLCMILVALLFTLGSLAIGYLLGGSSAETKGVIAFGTGFRNVTASLVVITATFADPENETLLMVLTVTLVSVILVSTIVGIIMKRRIQEGERIMPVV